MLAEMEAETDRIKFINIGMGLNVNNDPTPGEPKAISLRELMGRPVSRKHLVAQFLDKLERRIDPLHLAAVVQEWKRYSCTIGRHVKIITHNQTSEGTALDVDNNGALILQMADGSKQKIIYGDCFHQPG
jgi:BirA family biotin operon repressor/biotin-[acetyl-CoA-carboxylase] ligase